MGTQLHFFSASEQARIDQLQRMNLTGPIMPFFHNAQQRPFSPTSASMRTTSKTVQGRLHGALNLIFTENIRIANSFACTVCGAWAAGPGPEATNKQKYKTSIGACTGNSMLHHVLFVWMFVICSRGAVSFSLYIYHTYTVPGD